MPTKIFEIRDVTDDQRYYHNGFWPSLEKAPESYHTIGFWPSLGKVLDILDKNDPDSLETYGTVEDYFAVDVVEHKFGFGDGKVVERLEWNKIFNESEDCDEWIRVTRNPAPNRHQIRASRTSLRRHTNQFLTEPGRGIMLPLVMLNNSMAHKIAASHPGRVGIMFGPSRMRPARGLPVGLDNDRFAVWAHNKKWDENSYWKMLDEVQKTIRPIWAVVPDVVGDANETFREWGKWAPVLRKRGLPLALAVQDGMTPASVNRNADPEVVFVGGTRGWKRRTLWDWCRAFRRVHVGRVNYERWLWDAQMAGAESSDGTGWFRGNQVQYRGLLRYLKMSDNGQGPFQPELF